MRSILHIISILSFLSPAIGFSRELPAECDPLTYAVSYVSLPLDLQRDAKIIRHAGQKASSAAQAKNRENLTDTLTMVQAIFDSIIKNNNLESYVSGDQSLVLNVISTDEVDARTSYGTIDITTGITKLAGDESEIAFLLSHEISHHLLVHDLIRNKVSKEREHDADILGQKILIRSGFKAEASISFLKKLENYSQNSKMYYSIPERISQVSEILKECVGP